MSDHRLYSRALPGGGYVAIESAPEPVPEPTPEATAEETPGGPAVHALLLVERRADPTRRVGHTPPIVAEAIAVDSVEALEALFAIAADNVEIARALQLWQANRSSP